jgi:hypothetical protein
MFIFFEYILVAILIGATYFLRSFPSGWFQAAEQYLSRLARRRALAIFVVAALALALRVALLPNLPVPQPGIHDEFTYLLMGDTFAHGRLANPTPPMWIYFETFHIILKPTYVGLFYPAQGLVLALGQVIGGHPYIGVWLCSGAMCAAICWMLQGWLPPGWALLGGLLAVMRLGTFSYWANSYCLGALAAIGGALVLGALPRIKRYQKVQDSLLMGLGLAILANTRPYEGLFFSVPVAAGICTWMSGAKGPPLRRSLLRTVLPMSLLLAAAAGGMAYYFWRTTGSPFLPPYLVYMKTYVAVPQFPWQPLNLTHVYHHLVMEHFHRHDWPMYLYYLDREHPFKVLAGRVRDMYGFFLGPILALPLILTLAINPWQFLRKSITGKTGLLVGVCGVTFIGAALPIQFSPHYVAPVTAAVYALVLQTMRHLRLWRWRGKQAGLALVRAVPVICVLVFLLRALAPQLHIPTPYDWKYTWESEHFQNLDRARASAQLEALPGEQLVIVRYNHYHLTSDEWVYNRADIDASKVVWARDMGDSGNAELIRYFPQRRIWLAEPDLAPPRLIPYPVRADEQAPALRGTQ